jgi:hypothetical protein
MEHPENHPLNSKYSFFKARVIFIGKKLLCNIEEGRNGKPHLYLRNKIKFLTCPSLSPLLTLQKDTDNNLGHLYHLTFIHKKYCQITTLF